MVKVGVRKIFRLKVKIRKLIKVRIIKRFRVRIGKRVRVRKLIRVKIRIIKRFRAGARQRQAFKQVSSGPPQGLF